MNRGLNLDSNFIPTSLPEIEYNLFQFSGGEWHIKLNNNIQYEIVEEVIITVRIRTGEDIDGIGKEIYKDPKTDSGLKKSAKGLLQVKNGILKDQCTWEEEQDSDLKTVFKNGVLIKEFTLEEIRNNLNN